MRVFAELALGEEALEVVGSLAFVAGLLWVLERRQRGRRGEQAA